MEPSSRGMGLSPMAGLKSQVSAPGMGPTAFGSGHQPAGGNAGLDKHALRALHAHDRSPMYKHLLNNAALVVFCLAAGWLWRTPLWWLCLPCWLAAGHFFHTKPLSFHDAAHGTWHPVAWKNECMGHVWGTLILVPLSVYRHAHALHHAHPNGRRDPEMWPFVLPEAPRWFRLLSACVEIVCGFLYTPLLFLRSVLTAERVREGLWRRILREYLVILCFWGAVLAVVARLGWWTEFLVMFVVPLWIAGAYQTLNKYTEHLGVFGATILGSTRTVDDRRAWGRAFSAAIQNVDHHGTHHRYAKIPHYNLPDATACVFAGEADSLPPFPSYFRAFCDMLPHLADPKAGPQWLAGCDGGRAGVERSGSAAGLV